MFLAKTKVHFRLAYFERTCRAPARSLTETIRKETQMNTLEQVEVPSNDDQDATVDLPCQTDDDQTFLETLEEKLVLVRRERVIAREFKDMPREERLRV